MSTTDLVGRMLLMTKAHHSHIVSVLFLPRPRPPWAPVLIRLSLFSSGQLRLPAAHRQLREGWCRAALDLGLGRGWD